MFNQRKAKMLIEQELTLFPKASMTDIYKLFFQNCRGSGHFCQDLTIIKERITDEIKVIDLKNFHYPEYDISYLFEIKRVNLISIIKGKYDLNFVADRFLALSVMPNTLSIEAWTKEWSEIQKLTLKLYPEIINDLSIKNMDFSQSLHHSEIYRKSYHPHYRICNL